MHGSAMMYVTGSLYRGEQTPDQFAGSLEQRRLCDNLIEAGGMCAPQPCGVRVIRETEQRHIGERVGDVLGIYPSDVGNHEIGRIDAFRRHEPVRGKKRLQLAAEKEIDPYTQDRRHAYT
jgi:hypothetical protein